MPPNESTPPRDYEGIVVLGVPRSGTTLLRRLLDCHPQISCPPETNLLSACSRFLQEHPFAGGMSMGVRSGLAFSGIAGEEVLERLRELAFGILSRICRERGKAIWADKSAFDSFYLETVEELCAPRCRFIIMVRHGLDVVCSLNELCQKMETYVPELHGYVRRYPSHPEAFARVWAELTLALLALHERHRGRSTFLRYEDLVREPQAELERIFSDLELPANVAEVLALAAGQAGEPGLGDWKTYSQSRPSARAVERWKSELSAATAGTLAPLVNPLLEQLGYAPIPIREISPEEARHRYQLGLLAARLKSDASS